MKRLLTMMALAAFSTVLLAQTPPTGEGQGVDRVKITQTGGTTTGGQETGVDRVKIEKEKPKPTQPVTPAATQPKQPSIIPTPPNNDAGAEGENPWVGAETGRNPVRPARGNSPQRGNARGLPSRSPSNQPTRTGGVPKLSPKVSAKVGSGVSAPATAGGVKPKTLPPATGKPYNFQDPFWALIVAICAIGVSVLIVGSFFGIKQQATHQLPTKPFRKKR